MRAWIYRCRICEPNDATAVSACHYVDNARDTTLKLTAILCINLLKCRQVCRNCLVGARGHSDEMRVGLGCREIIIDIGDTHDNIVSQC